LNLDPWILTAGVLLYLAAFPAVVFFINLTVFKAPEARTTSGTSPVSVLIPARNEAANIRAVLESVLVSREAGLEVLVLDDHSSDETPVIVEQMAATDPRLRLLRGAGLPPGWAGKMFACQQLAEAAHGEWLLFLDADVRLAPEAVRRLVDYARTAPHRPVLVSGVPRQITGSWLECLLVPLIDFILLGYLPLWIMRRRPSPSLAASVGQLVLVKRESYFTAGGHAAIRATFHDGVKLPRELRKHGFLTDLVDISGLAHCRMYQGARQTWNGFLKNAAEGLGAPGVIVPMTLILIGGQVLPWILLCLPDIGLTARRLLLAAAALGYLQRLVAAVRFRQSWFGALLHPLGIILMEAIQWTGFLRHLRGIQSEWKGRRAVSTER
jgi:GT2 family glycosyltransferase